MSKLKLPVTHVVTVEDKEVGQTFVYELCTVNKARWAIKEALVENLDASGVVYTQRSLDALIDDAVDARTEVSDLVERGLVFSDPDETGPY